MKEEMTIGRKVTLGPGGSVLLAERWKVLRSLGHGGMGSVCLVEDRQLDGKLFAAKMLPPFLVSDRRSFAQLKEEAKVAMRLTHPNIVTLRAFEENNGNPFLVMDYIDGQTLDDYLADKGMLSEEAIISVLRPIAAALDYAHTKGVVHRDIKPSNVMISNDGTPYILDFGIAREVKETMTRVTGKLSSGTLLYMSPEQLNGAPPKKEQDVYSFAAMVYECISGAPPFSRGQIEYQIMNSPPPPLPPGCAISDLVMVGLSKDPAERPTTCAAVLGVDASAAASAEPMPALNIPGVGDATEWRTNDEPLSDEDKRFAEALCAKLRKRGALPPWLDETSLYDMPQRAVAASIDRIAREWMRESCRRGLRRYIPLFTRNDWSRWSVRAQNGAITSRVGVAIYEFVRDDDMLSKAR